MTPEAASSKVTIRQSSKAKTHPPSTSRVEIRARTNAWIFEYRRKTLADLLNANFIRSYPQLDMFRSDGGTTEHELVKPQDQEKVRALLNKFVTSVKQIQVTLLLKPPLSSVPNPGGLRNIAGHALQLIKDRCGDEIDEANNLLKKIRIRPQFSTDAEGRSLEVAMEAASNREFSDTVADAFLTVTQLVERKELDMLRRCDCGKWYFASRSDQKSCSATCRQRRHANSPEFRATRRAYRKTLAEMKKTPKSGGKATRRKGVPTGPATAR